MAANENALIQPKFELGMNGIIQDVFQGDWTTKQKKWKIVGKLLIIFHGRGGGGPPPRKNPKKKIIFFMGFFQGGGGVTPIRQNN